MTEYISCANTAKLIRKALKEAFPATKFSVRSDTYAGGASIRVTWNDGPTSKSVEAVACRFQGGYFDGMTDYKGGHTHQFQGREVHFGADFVFCNRTVTDAHMANVKATWRALSEGERSALFDKTRPDIGLYNPPSSFYLDDDLTDFGDNAEEAFSKIARDIPGAGTVQHTSTLAESAQLERSY